MLGGAPSTGLGVLDTWVPAKEKNKKRNVPTNSPTVAMKLLRVVSAIPNMGSWLRVNLTTGDVPSPRRLRENNFRKTMVTNNSESNPLRSGAYSAAFWRGIVFYKVILPSRSNRGRHDSYCVRKCPIAVVGYQPCYG